MEGSNPSFCAKTETPEPQWFRGFLLLSQGLAAIIHTLWGSVYDGLKCVCNRKNYRWNYR